MAAFESFTVGTGVSGAFRVIAAGRKGRHEIVLKNRSASLMWFGTSAVTTDGLPLEAGQLIILDVLLDDDDELWALPNTWPASVAVMINPR